jgi:hypothetical protein
MLLHAKEGVWLAEMIALATPVCREAQRIRPRRGPGCPPRFPDWMMAVLIMVAIAKRKKTKSAQWRYLQEHEEELAGLLGVDRLPSRSTYYDRYRRADALFVEAIRLMGAKAVRYGWADAHVVAVDKSIVAARGPVRHQGRRSRRGFDPDAAWGRNQHDGWVYGYGYEVVVSCGPDGVLWPLVASADRANRGESVTFREKVPQLPRATRYVLADRGYDADDTCEAIEWEPSGQRTGRRFVCPTIERYNARRPRREAWKESRERKQRRTHREQRKRFLATKKGRALYGRRGKTIEPFNSWFKALFELEDRVWHRGIDNNRTQLAAALFTYQLLLRINWLHGAHNGRVKWILDAI